VKTLAGGKLPKSTLFVANLFRVFFAISILEIFPIPFASVWGLVCLRHYPKFFPIHFHQRALMLM